VFPTVRSTHALRFLEADAWSPLFAGEGVKGPRLQEGARLPLGFSETDEVERRLPLPMRPMARRLSPSPVPQACAGLQPFSPGSCSRRDPARPSLLRVYDERVDRIVGQLDCLDLLGIDGDLPITCYIQPVDYVPKTRSLQDLLRDMRRDGRLMSVVVDEFGAAEGIMTVEDIIEEVVEDIEDEYDTDEDHVRQVKKLGKRDFPVSARIELDDFADQLGPKLPSGHYTSLSGFLLAQAKCIPPVGAVHQGIRFTIKVASRHQRGRVQWQASACLCRLTRRCSRH
jgi:hypothetical protein